MKQLIYLEFDPQEGAAEKDALLLSLPSHRRERLLRCRHEADRLAGLYADVLLRCLICQSAGIGLEAVDIRAGKTGKPYLAGSPSCEFNISHTRYAVAAALADKPVGVDIERLRDIDDAVARRVFSENELRLYEAAPDRALRFFELWTKKEALVKCRGSGLIGDLKALDTAQIRAGEEISTFRAGGYVLSVCSAVRFGEDELKKIEVGDLIRLWRDCAASTSHF